jgi:hypothetical protein
MNSVTVKLSKPAFQRLQQAARRSRRSVDEYASEMCATMATASPGEFFVPLGDCRGLRMKRWKDSLDDIDSALKVMELLSDADLKRAFKTVPTKKSQREMAELNDKAQSVGLLKAEKERSGQLREYFDQCQLIRANAAAILNQRGVDVNKLLRP